jgi:hypothetical protein
MDKSIKNITAIVFTLLVLAKGQESFAQQSLYGLRLQDANNHVLTITAPTAGFGASYNFRFPSAMAGAGSLLYSSDGIGQTAWLAAGSNGQVLTLSGGFPTWVTPTTGTVTSVSLSLPSIFALSGSPITSSGTFSATLNNQSSNLVFAGPSSGAAATPAFRSLVAADIPSLAYVASVGLSLPSIFTVSNSPITSSGTLTGALATQSANLIFAGPSTGVAAAPTFRSLAAADIPNLDAAKITTGAFSEVRGGTNQSSYTTGDILYASAANTLSKLPIGSSNQVLTVSGGIPSWQTSSAAATGANPTASVGLTAVNGSATTFMRSDAAPALDLTIAPTWTGIHTWKVNNATTNAIDPIRYLGHNSTGTPANGFGLAEYFTLKSSSTVDQNVGALVFSWSNATHATRTGNFALQLVNNGGSLTNVLTVNGAGTSIAFPSYGAGALYTNGSGAISAGTLAETNGGTNQSTYTKGDILYASGANTLTKLPIGSSNQVLSVSGGIPSWTSTGNASTTISSTYQARAPISTTTTSTTLVNATGLTFPINAGEVWSFRAEMNITTSSTDGYKPAISIPSGATIQGEWDGLYDLGANGHQIYGEITTGGAPVTTLTSNTGFQAVAGTFGAVVYGTVDNSNGVSGTVQIQISTENASNTVTLKKNSFLTAWQYSRALDITYTSSTTWTVPSGVTTIYVNGIGGAGGGGGGGGKVTTTSKNGGGGGGGGGAGEYISNVALTVTPGEILTITIGAAGTAGTAGTGSTNIAATAGGNGGNTTIVGSVSGTIFTANGGTGGGPGGQGNATVGAAGTLGAGGVVAGSTPSANGTTGNAGTAGAIGTTSSTASAGGTAGSGPTLVNANTGGSGGSGGETGANGIQANGSAGTAGTIGYIEIAY